MTKKELEQFLPKFRTGALSMKEFGKLSKKEKDQYILDILEISKEERGDVDNHILRYYHLEIKEVQHFFTIED
jgi:hypothetical protein